jgi:hypothetical protein
MIVSLMLALCGCGPSEEKQAKRLPPQSGIAANENFQSLTETNRSNESYLRQLHANIKIADGLLTIEGSILPSITVLPVNSGWSVSCGISGLSVVFGGGVSGSVDAGSGSVENDAKLDLSIVPVSVERCREIAPLIGREVRTILGQ